MEQMRNLNVDFIRTRLKEIIDLVDPINLCLVFAFVKALLDEQAKEET